MEMSAIIAYPGHDARGPLLVARAAQLSKDPRHSAYGLISDCDTAPGGTSSYLDKGAIARVSFCVSSESRGKEVLVLSAAMEDYLRTIYVLGGQQTPVNTTALAVALDVTPASVTGMMKRLAELKLVTHEPYRGVVLTTAGTKVALEVLRHHRLIELYLAEAFGYSWDQVHEEADRLEHAISEELEARIFAVLGHPTHDPHGDPIPTYEGDLPIEAGEPLTALDSGDRAVILRVLNQDGPLLRYLAHLGLVPQTEIEVLEVAPFEGPVTVAVSEIEHALGRELARQIVVDRIK